MTFRTARRARIAKPTASARPSSPTSIDLTALYTALEAAAYLRSNARTLERWRTAGTGPAFVKIGRRVAYRLTDLDRWVEEQRRTHTRGR